MTVAVFDAVTIEAISTAIWRAGFVKDGNKVRQQAKESALRLAAINIAVELGIDVDDFLKGSRLK